ncbi:MAG: glycosyltransferase, partial [Tepidisphaerales bacterium]
MARIWVDFGRIGVSSRGAARNSGDPNRCTLPHGPDHAHLGARPNRRQLVHPATPSYHSSMARILIFALGSAGDVHPMIALALSLRERGHEVAFAVNPHFHP